MTWQYLADSAAGCMMIGIFAGTAMLVQQAIRKLWRKLRGRPAFYNWKKAKEFGDTAARAVMKDLGMEGNSALQDSVSYRAAAAIYEYAELYQNHSF